MKQFHALLPRLEGLLASLLLLIGGSCWALPFFHNKKYLGDQYIPWQRIIPLSVNISISYQPGGVPG